MTKVALERLQQNPTKDLTSLRSYMNFTLYDEDLKKIEATLEMEAEDTPASSYQYYQSPFQYRMDNKRTYGRGCSNLCKWSK
jgi:hypothetical protein